jgi:dihydrolipoamide dehydrogenase
MATQYDLVVIGAGPGGYVAAIRAAQLGLRVACIESESRLGGTCLRVGCIPSKALLEASERYWEAKHHFADMGIKLSGVELDLATMLKKKDGVVTGLTQGIEFLFKKHKVERVVGHGQILAPGRVLVRSSTGEAELEAARILIATGSKSAPLRGVDVDGEVVVTSTEALSFARVPEHLVVIGAGVIGLELGSVWLRLGAKVTVVEYLDRILPGMDTELASEARRLFTKQGFEFLLSSKVIGARKTATGAVVEVEGREPIACDRVLLAVGRVPNTDGLGLDSLGLQTGPRGVIAVDEHYQTKSPGIYAIGDVIAGPMLAHKAEEEGIACVEHMATGYGHVNYDAIPSVVYTHPELATVGKTEEQLTAAGIPFKKGVFPFTANARARALGATEGRVKILAHAETDRVLGVHILGARAGDLIAEAGVAMEFGASAEDLARTCHAHPTLAEALKEAALAVDARPIHI